MLGKLTENQIEALLSSQYIGRLGCSSAQQCYIVPLNYIYRKGAIYCHSAPGRKISIMRGNPKVCFQVDNILDTYRWESVICIGKFEEVTETSEKQQAIQGIIHKMMPLTNSPEQQPAHGTGKEGPYEDGVTVFKITIREKTGRFEKQDAL